MISGMSLRAEHNPGLSLPLRLRQDERQGDFRSTPRPPPEAGKPESIGDTPDCGPLAPPDEACVQAMPVFGYNDERASP